MTDPAAPPPAGVKRFVSESSPSFLIAVGLILALALGYAIYVVAFPGPHRQSDEIVRQFNRESGGTLGAFRRQTRSLVRNVQDGSQVAAEAEQAIDEALREARRTVEDQADAALAAVESLEIGFNTLQNRTMRIERNAEKALERLEETAQDARVALQPTAPPS